MKKSIILIMVLFFSSTVVIASCYVKLDEPGSFDKKVVNEFSMINISNYIQKVSSIPVDGIDAKSSCLYNIVINEQDNGLTVTIRGDSLSGAGESKLRGLDGFKQAILRSIIKGKSGSKYRICEDYKSLMESDCQNSGQRKQNITTYRIGDDDFESNPQALKKYKMAQIFKKRQKPDKARMFYQQILEQYPTSLEAIFVRMHLMTELVVNMKKQGSFDEKLFSSVNEINPKYKRISVYKTLQVETSLWLTGIVKMHIETNKPNESLYKAVLDYKKNKATTSNINSLNKLTINWMISLGELELTKSDGELMARGYFKKAEALGLSDLEINNLNNKLRAAQIKGLILKGKKDEAEIALVEWEVEEPNNPYLIKLQKIFERPGNMVTITGGRVRGDFVASFNLDIYEVTNQEFLEFVKQNPEYQKSNIKPEINDKDYLQRWSRDLQFDPKYENVPVVFISQLVASAYCKWAGKRLPTDLEWGLAAGEGKRNYPWGNQPPTDELANFKKGLLGDPLPGDSHPLGATPEGIMHMGGNVWELTSTIAENGQAISRGGCYYDSAEKLHNKNKTLTTDPVNYSSRFMGFRCAQ